MQKKKEKKGKVLPAFFVIFFSSVFWNKFISYTQFILYTASLCSCYCIIRFFFLFFVFVSSLCFSVHQYHLLFFTILVEILLLIVSHLCFVFFTSVYDSDWVELFWSCSVCQKDFSSATMNFVQLFTFIFCEKKKFLFWKKKKKFSSSPLL